MYTAQQHNIKIDPWTFYDYKATFEANVSIYNPPRWAKEHHRRLIAYMLLDTYTRNAGRTWLDHRVLSKEEQNSRREYGDASILVETALASLLGDDMSIVVQGTDQPNPPAGAAEQQTRLRAWADAERLDMKVIDCERKAVNLGDGVYVLSWDEENGRPRVTVYDPSNYFPVLDYSTVDDEYPTKVHICWEWEEEDENHEKEFYVRKLTWEMMETPDERDYPWNASPVKLTCMHQDMIWKLTDDINAIIDLSDEVGESQLVEGGQVVEELDLHLDFIPVIHEPNTIPGEEHFGTSVLARVMQALDDIMMTDTDLQSSSRTTGSPPIAVNGASLPTDSDGKIATYGPGTVWTTGDGTATMIDTSTSLDALLKYSDHLREVLSVNSRTPEALLGRVKPNEVPSGIALTLSFSPHSHMIREMRMVRKEKYRLLFKFVLRMMWQNDDAFSPSELFTTDMHFGSFLPADRSETATLVNQLFRVEGTPMISLETAVRMLVEAGIPVEDIVKEVEAIRQNDFKTAGDALDATGDLDFARKRLGLGPLAPGTGVPVPPPTPGPELPQ